MSTQQSNPVQNQRKFTSSILNKLGLVYDIFMMLLFFINVFCLVGDAILTSGFAQWVAKHLSITHYLDQYMTHLHPWVLETEYWFTALLLTEILVLWIIAIAKRHYPRWFFFPFVHWYEVLALIPELRFLRLFRAAVIAYRLHEMGYHIIPKNIYKKAEFYYYLILEELTRRIVLTVVHTTKRELKNSSKLHITIHEMLDNHRAKFADAFAELLQQSLAKALAEKQRQMSHNVGQIVNKAIEDTPELHQLLRLLPVIGGRLESQIQSIGQRLGENIMRGLVDPFVEDSERAIANDTLQLIARKTSETHLDNERLNQLIEDVVFDSLEIIRERTKQRDWETKIHLKSSEIVQNNH